MRNVNRWSTHRRRGRQKNSVAHGSHEVRRGHLGVLTVVGKIRIVGHAVAQFQLHFAVCSVEDGFVYHATYFDSESFTTLIKSNNSCRAVAESTHQLPSSTGPTGKQTLVTSSTLRFCGKNERPIRKTRPPDESRHEGKPFLRTTSYDVRTKNIAVTKDRSPNCGAAPCDAIRTAPTVPEALLSRPGTSNNVFEER